MFTTALFTITKIWKQHPLMDKWVKKLWYMHMGCVWVCVCMCTQPQKKSNTLPFAATWMWI